MDKIKNIYDDFFSDVSRLQKQNQKKLDELNKTLYGENGILKDSPLGDLAFGGKKRPGSVSEEGIIGAKRV